MNTTKTTHEDLVDKIRQAWADVLGDQCSDSVPLDVNFLKVGGNSLLLVMLWELLQPLASRPLQVAELFRHSTVRAQADFLYEQAGADMEHATAAVRSDDS